MTEDTGRAGSTGPLRFSLNGKALEIESVPLARSLLDVLSNHPASPVLTKPCAHHACDRCTVRVDGTLARACRIPAVAVSGLAVECAPVNSRIGLRRACPACGVGIFDRFALARADHRTVLSCEHCAATFRVGRGWWLTGLGVALAVPLEGLATVLAFVLLLQFFPWYLAVPAAIVFGTALSHSVLTLVDLWRPLRPYQSPEAQAAAWVARLRAQGYLEPSDLRRDAPTEAPTAAEGGRPGS